VATMHGIVKERPEYGAVWHDNLPVPSYGPDEMLVKVKAAAICGTDLHIYRWNAWSAKRLKLPMIFGHEFAGEVVAVGDQVKRFKPGDRVSGETHIGCETCRMCMTGNIHNCEAMKILGVHVPGCFAEYIAVPEMCGWHLDPALTYEQGALLEPMGVAMHAIEMAEVGGRDVLVLGAGPIGLMAAGICHVWGANQVIVSEPVLERLKIAATMGATKMIQAGKEDVPAIVMALTGGKGVDVVLEYSGSPKAIDDGFASLAKGGKVVFAGLPDEKVPIDISDSIIYKEATITGVTGRLMYKTWFECQKVLRSGKFSLDPVIGGRFAMKDFPAAFAAGLGGAPGKMLLIP
jgi:threonine 3-dehydrogenase